MKTYLPFIVAAACAGSATAGDLTLYNDQAFPRLGKSFSPVGSSPANG